MPVTSGVLLWVVPNISSFSGGSKQAEKSPSDEGLSYGNGDRF
jgi:hypothetical protein